MGVIAKILTRDLKRILKNPVALIVALGVCILPSLYAWINILANWDPYENTSTVPVAVVIQDTGAEVSGMGTVNAGQMVHERLEQNHQLQWTFLDSKDDALSGVRSGRYYAAFVIPADFTSTLAGVLDGHVSQAKVDYYVNEKVNAVAPKVTDTGATTLETQIAQEFVSVAGQAVTEKLQGAVSDAATSMGAASAGAASTLSGVGTLLDNLAESLDSARAPIASAQETISTAQTTLADAADGARDLSSSLDSALAGLSGAREKARSFMQDLDGQLLSASTTISGITSSASHDVGQLAGSVGWAQGKLDAAIAQVRAANGTIKSIESSLEATRKDVAALSPSDGAAQDAAATGSLQHQITAGLDSELQLLIQLSDDQLAALDSLQAKVDNIAAGADAVRNLSASLNDAAQTGTSTLLDLRTQLAQDAAPQLTSALDALSDAGGRAAGGAAGLAPMIEQASGTLEQLDGLLGQADSTLAATTSSLRDSATHLSSLSSDLSALQGIESQPVLSDVLSLNAQESGSALGSPVEMVDEPVFPVANYGSGVAPFYTNLALWVGGFVLVAIYKAEVDREGLDGLTVTSTHAFLGRWLLFALMGQIQAIICCVGDLALGVQCVSPPAFVFAGMMSSLVYVLVIYALAVALKHVGKALAVLLVVLQIPGASGLYPIQMQPTFFRALNPWLPFTYGIGAMREAVAGFYGTTFARDLLMLLLFAVPALLLGIVARRRLLNVNALFDRKMAETDLLVTERDNEKSTDPMALFLEALAGSSEHRDEFLVRAAHLDFTYPRRARRGVIALLATPLVLIALLPAHPTRIVLLVLWVVALVAASWHLIRLEYVHERLLERVGLVRHARGELEELLEKEHEEDKR